MKDARMPGLDAARDALLAALHEAFGSLVEEQTVDIVPVEGDGDAAEVQADDWTLFVKGWPPSTAWIALDEEVSAPEALRTALESALAKPELVALASLDAALSGELATALNGSGDELSIALAAILAADIAHS